jgi:uncharacterized membrane protein (UPF0182 family)
VLRSIATAGIVVIGGLILLTVSAGMLVDWLWFADLGYLGVFWVRLATKTSIFFAVLILIAGLVWLNGWLALRSVSGRKGPWALAVAPKLPWSPAASGLTIGRPHLRLLLPLGAGLIGMAVALFETGNWDVLLRFLFQVPYGESEPVFGKDIGFYLFTLPAYVALKNLLLVTVALSGVAAGAVYWLHGDIDFEQPRRHVSRAALAHGSALLGAFFLVKAWSYGLDRYLLLYRDNGVVVGASYTDLHVELPVLGLLIALALLASLMCWANLWLRSYRLPLAAVALVLGSAFLLAEVLPALFLRLVVKPNELELEKRNIALTQRAYDLRKIAVRPFSAEQSLTLKSLEANRPTIENIRLWDWQPLLDAYRQLQEIRTYYRFQDVDVDRYWLDGAYRQVTLSARELSADLLPPNAQTWVNRHVLFTHGNGVVMGPVTQKSAEGLPVFYLHDIPPVAAGGPPLREPRIYFGELKDTYVIVNGSTPEFDYPKGKDNVFARYAGRRGVPVGGIGQRALFAWYFTDPNLLLTDYITAESRILFRRTVRERVRTIAPFLRLDRDPYPVVSDGRLFWIQDAYTTSSYFPYAQRTPRGDLNYIRNAAKIVVDAYDGTVDFYLADRSDPIAQTYQRTFSGLFKPLAALPADLQSHIRYPEGLFLAQAQIYRAYHMDAPEVFYNREDLWQFPREPGGPDAKMPPFYMIMRLPGEAQAEFILMLPMVPSERENMIAWLAARCDPPHYGELIVYEFPKEKLVFGPFQIEARINQDTFISQQLSLWNQMGSRVIRGNLHVIPIDDSLLYVSPLYLRAETGQIPELKRVIAAYGDQVVMEESLADALTALFGRPAVATAPDGRSAQSEPGVLAGEALKRYTRALERLKAGDWSGFGAELEAMRTLLEAAAGRSPDQP